MIPVIVSSTQVSNFGRTFDAIGNRIVADELGTNTVYSANALNQYTNIVSTVEFHPEFDDDGNQTKVKTSTGVWHVTYNAENRPVVWSNETAVVTMDYDRMGRRVWYASVTGGETNAYSKFVYDGYLCVQRLDGFTGEVEQKYVWDPTETVATRPLKWTLPGLGRAFFYFHDGNKNVSDVIDASDGSLAAHYDYAPFGAVVESSGPLAVANPFRFSSEYHDTALGCDYYNYRHYNPLDGRWMSRDPIEEIEEHNCYGMCYNALSSYFDKLGNSAASQHGEETKASGTGCSISPCLDFCSKMMLVSSRLACERNCRGAKEKFEKWFKENSNLDWTKKLLDCPCDIGKDKKSGDSSGVAGWGALTDKLHGYHVGASLCMRSTPVDGHANQCCYDKCGKLITHGAGAGSADYVPGTVWTYFGHNAADMQPADWAKILDGGTWGCWSDAYLLRRPQKGSEKCDRNP